MVSDMKKREKRRKEQRLKLYTCEFFISVLGVKTYFIRARKSDFVNQFITNVTSLKSISPLLQSRNRLSSCNNQVKPRHHYLHMVTNASNYRMKANSLPSILDSENGDDIMDEKDDLNKSPMSTASYGKKKVRNKPWRYLQRQRTTEEMAPLEIEEGRNIVMERAKPDFQIFEECNGFRRVGNSLLSFLTVAYFVMINIYDRFAGPSKQ